MPKFNNTYKTHPHMTQLLESEIYARRRSIPDMSQYVLAEKIGVSRNCIYLMECHEHIPKIETIFDIMMALGFSVEERTSFLVKYMDAYYKDKELQRKQENELAGVL